jgi:hypothetical protein
MWMFRWRFVVAPTFARSGALRMGHPLYLPLPLNQSFLEEQLERELTDAGITG